MTNIWTDKEVIRPLCNLQFISNRFVRRKEFWYLTMSHKRLWQDDQFLERQTNSIAFVAERITDLILWRDCKQRDPYKEQWNLQPMESLVDPQYQSKIEEHVHLKGEKRFVVQSIHITPTDLVKGQWHWSEYFQSMFQDEYLTMVRRRKCKQSQDNSAKMRRPLETIHFHRTLSKCFETI